MLENEYQARLIRQLKFRFPGCMVMKNDTSYQQGMPDLTVLWRDRWAVLEVKKNAQAVEQPNQAWFIARLDTMSFAAFIYPENEAEVLDALQRALKSPGSARLPKR